MHRLRSRLISFPLLYRLKLKLLYSRPAFQWDIPINVKHQFMKWHVVRVNVYIDENERTGVAMACAFLIYILQMYNSLQYALQLCFQT